MIRLRSFPFFRTLVALALFSSPLPAVTITYSIVDLGTLGGGSSEAYGINASGQVVGYARTSTGFQHAFIWQNGSGMQDLGSLGEDSWASDINDHGQVVVFSDTSKRSYIWQSGTDMHDLGMVLATFRRRNRLSAPRQSQRRMTSWC